MRFTHLLQQGRAAPGLSSTATAGRRPDRGAARRARADLRAALEAGVDVIARRRPCCPHLSSAARRAAGPRLRAGGSRAGQDDRLASTTSTMPRKAAATSPTTRGSSFAARARCSATGRAGRVPRVSSKFDYRAEARGP
jgi:hypothetical protein